MSLEWESDISDIEKTSTCHRKVLIFRRLCYPCNECHLFANLFFIFPLPPYPSVILSTAKNLLASTNACQIREGELKKRLHVFPKRQQLFRIFLQLFSILEEAWQ